MVRGAIFVGLGLAACGPIIDLPASSDGSTTGSSPPSTGAAQSGPPDGEAGALDGSEVDGGVASEDEGASLDDGVIPTDLPADDPPGLCELDPYALDPRDMTPYRACMRGLAELTVYEEQFSGIIIYGGYAQFYSVLAEADIDWEMDLLDPFDGTLDDCRLARYGNSGYGETEQVLWEDAGDLSFALGEMQVPAEEYGDPVSVLGYTLSAHELGIAPAYLAPHGFVATGDTTEPMAFADAVVLPELIELVAPTLDGEAVIDPGSFALEWIPGTTGVPFEIQVNVAVAGDWDFQLFCRVVDDGEFVVPAELAQQLPHPADARLWVRRADVRVVMSGDRGVLVTAAAQTEGPFSLDG